MSTLNFHPPTTDPTPIFEAFRGSYATELLTAAVAHFKLFELLHAGPTSFDSLAKSTNLAPRAATVLLTALCGMGLLSRRQSDGAPLYELTAVAREHLLPGGPFYVGDYVGLTADSPGVKEMIERLQTNRPPGAKPDEAAGTAFIFREGTRSAMDAHDSARKLTLALAGRAKNVAPVLAQKLPLPNSKLLLDIGGGTGIYAYAFLQANPTLRAIIWDRPEVLKVAEELSETYGVKDRVEFRPGDMFTDPVPTGCDVALLSNILHDWDVPECQTLVTRCASALQPGGQLLIHDVFLNDNLDGPLPIALYSAALFSITEGRAYSALEYRNWLETAGLSVSNPITTLVHCGVLTGKK